MFTFGLLCFTSFFTLINPLGAMPVFMTMTMELDEKERRKVARRASLVSFLIMMFFAISGDLLFRFFGISIDSLRIVGGIIFLIMGMDMLQARLVKTKVKESEVKSYVNDISITPLSIPQIINTISKNHKQKTKTPNPVVVSLVNNALSAGVL